MKIRRRKYFINARLQMRFAVFFLIISLVGNIAAVAAFNMLAMDKIDALLWSSHIDITSTNELVGPLFIQVNLINLAFVTVLLLLTGTWMMKRTTGPIYRMSQDIKTFTEGDLTSRIILRNKDEFADVAGELNNMAESLRERFAGIRDRYSSISESTGALIKGDGNKEEALRNCDLILKSIEELETEISSRFEK